jgi:hypothetical protein
MGRNQIIGLVVGAVIVVGGVAFAATQGGESDNSNSATTQTEGSTESDSTAFNPVNTMESDFVATFTISSNDSEEISSVVEYDADGKTWQTTTNADGQEVKALITDDAYYTYANDQWLKLPKTEASSASGLNPEDYEVTADELTEFQNVLQYKGEASCPAGTCDLWEAENYQGNDMISFYVNKSDNTINQIVTKTIAGTSTIVYEYKDVTIEVPTDVREVPQLGQ